MPEIIVTAGVLLLLVAAALIIFMLARQAAKPAQSIEAPIANIEKSIERVERAVRDEASKSRQEADAAAAAARKENADSTRALADSLQKRMAENASLQLEHLNSFARRLESLTKSNDEKMEKLRETIEQRLRAIQEDNAGKLEQMRATVDEKLQSTLEKRLGESFKLVSERLETVHKGLGEMQTLAAGVGDLKKVLSNVKTRGIWGEIQLGALLEQLLTREQYAENVATKKGSADRVEFAVRLPGGDDSEEAVWLPIDSKFPFEHYQRVIEASEAGDAKLVEESLKNLETQIRLEARRIRDKYIDPPGTTDFAILFLPVEGLYTEALRRPGLWDTLQRDCRVVIAGPTTLSAFLNSLQMGFRTLTIQKRSSEVWRLLGEVKTEFGKFGDVLDKTKKKLQEASNSISDAAVRTRAIERKLGGVQELPSGDLPQAIENGAKDEY